MKLRDINLPDHTRDAIQSRARARTTSRTSTLAIPLNELIVVTGVSGSGKSSLVFDTLYAEGQRRYVETFSPYARQFLDRMDKPQVDRIEGIPPAIAIDQTNPVRTSRSTVGTMTELNDHLKLLFARAAQLYCRGCGEPVRARHAGDASTPTLARARRGRGRSAPRRSPSRSRCRRTSPRRRSCSCWSAGLHAHPCAARSDLLEVVQDRLRARRPPRRARVIEALEAALQDRPGQGERALADRWRSAATERARRDRESGASPPTCTAPTATSITPNPTPRLFSFNSPLGACDTCRGFGRVIGIDFGLVVPDEGKTLREGAVGRGRRRASSECQDDLVKYASKRGIPLDTPWRELSDSQRNWVLEGEPEWMSWQQVLARHLVRRARASSTWLETKAYKMHIRVLLSKYRAYTPCTACDGARLKPRRCCGASARAGCRSVLPQCSDSAARRQVRRCDSRRCPGSRCTT